MLGADIVTGHAGKKWSSRLQAQKGAQGTAGNAVSLIGAYLSSYLTCFSLQANEYPTLDRVIGRLVNE